MGLHFGNIALGYKNLILGREKELMETRLLICKTSGPDAGSCHHFKLGLCWHCGCPGIVKGRVPKVKCPIGKW